MESLYSTNEELLEILETIIECSNDGFWSWDLETDVEYLSPRFKEILGYSINEMENNAHEWQKLIFKEDLELALYNLDKHLKDPNHSYYQKVRYRHKDGSIVWVICRGIAIRNKDGKPTKLVGIHTDITDMKNIEEKLKIESEKAKKAILAKTIFLASMSHEIRTPMNSIMGLLQVLTYIENNKKKKNIVTKIMDSANMLSNILDDILDYSKMDSDKISLQYANTNIKKNTKTIIKKYKKLYPNLKYKSNFYDIKNHYYLDEARFIQVISNLISNASKYTVNGKIYISIKEIDNSLLIKIKDTGIGMTKETMKNIFEPFYRDEQGEFLATGTGLGLSICKKICYYMDSDLWCKSKVGKGSTFYLKIKVKQCNNINEICEKHTENNKYPLNKRLKIAITEDNKNNIFVIEELLALFDQKLYFIAQNGKEIVEEIKKNDYDIIFMDDKMPIMSGVEATQIIKKIKPDIYIVALTANALYGDKERYLTIMDDYIGKPVLINDLEKLFNRYLNFKQTGIRPNRRESLPNFET